jgi:hypothetical protein
VAVSSSTPQAHHNSSPTQSDLSWPAIAITIRDVKRMSLRKDLLP